MTLQEDERLAAGAERSQALSDQARADGLTLKVGAHSDRTQDQHVEESGGSVDERARVQDLADDGAVNLRNEGEVVVPCPRRPQFVEQQSNRRVPTKRSN